MAAIYWQSERWSHVPNQLSLAQGMTVNLFIRSAQMRFFVPKQETECLARIFHQHVNVFAIPSR